jgi:hypothetical protein
MAENPFALDEDVEEDEEQSEAPSENQSFAELRKAYKRTERQNKAFEKELADLREFKSTVVQEQRRGQVESVFKEVGLSPKHALLFEKVNPEAEITPEVVQTFAAEYDLITQAGDSVQAPEVAPTGFTPVVTGTSPAAGMLTHSDIKEMLARGETQAVEKAYEQGRVIKEVAPWASE